MIPISLCHSSWLVFQGHCQATWLINNQSTWLEHYHLLAIAFVALLLANNRISEFQQLFCIHLSFKCLWSDVMRYVYEDFLFQISCISEKLNPPGQPSATAPPTEIHTYLGIRTPSCHLHLFVVMFEMAPKKALWHHKKPGTPVPVFGAQCLNSNPSSVA